MLKVNNWKGLIKEFIRNQRNGLDIIRSGATSGKTVMLNFFYAAPLTMQENTLLGD